MQEFNFTGFLPVTAALLLIALAPGNAWAQAAASASIVGRVVDDSGAPMPDVKVAVTGPALQVPEVSVATDSDGNYKVLDLPAPGVY
jgi:hypothetical protein